jgi:hypothetical protein
MELRFIDQIEVLDVDFTGSASDEMMNPYGAGVR